MPNIDVVNLMATVTFLLVKHNFWKMACECHNISIINPILGDWSFAFSVIWCLQIQLHTSPWLSKSMFFYLVVLHASALSLWCSALTWLFDAFLSLSFTSTKFVFAKAELSDSFLFWWYVFMLPDHSFWMTSFSFTNGRKIIKWKSQTLKIYICLYSYLIFLSVLVL